MVEQNGTTANAELAKPRKTFQLNKKQIFYYGLMFLPLLQFCIFYIGVNFQSILLAFQGYDLGEFVSAKEKYGDLFYNFRLIYTNIVESSEITDSVVNSLILWFFTAICGTLIAIFFSYFVFKSKRIGRFYRFILFIPSILPGVLLANIFKALFNEILPLLFGWPALFNSTDPTIIFQTAMIYSIFVGFGTQVLLYSNAMEQISPSILEAAELDGVSTMKELFLVILPNIMGTVSTFMIATIAGAFTNQANLFTFHGKRAKEFGVSTLGYYLFVLAQDKGEYGYASALGICCTVVAIVPTILFRKFSKRFEE